MTIRSQEKLTYWVEQVWLLETEQTGPFPAGSVLKYKRGTKVTRVQNVLLLFLYHVNVKNAE